jgi:cysteine desulfurase
LENNTTLMEKKIYFDNAATTRLDPRVLKAMLPLFGENYGNASSLHGYGTLAKEALEDARIRIADCINARPEEIIFTSGGTESNNFALKGIANASRRKGRHIIVSTIEHDCVLNTCKWLETQGFSVTYLPVDEYGLVSPETVEENITPETILVSVMYANNEIGTIEPVSEIGVICKKHDIPFHTDACQAFGKLRIDVNHSSIDLMTINAHKIYGPKGVGALYIRKGTRIEPLLHGGGQERGLRSTTENLPGIAGFAEAAAICQDEMFAETDRLIALRKRLENYLLESFDNVYFHGHPAKRLPGLLSFSFSGLEGETIRLLFLLDEMGIAVSAGSACSSNEAGHHNSHVLQAIGLNQFEARGAIRLSLGRFNTEGDIAAFMTALQQAVPKLNKIYSL